MDATRIAIIAGMAVVSYLPRAAPQLFFMGRSFPEPLDRYLRYLSYALIASIVATSLFIAGSRFEASAAPHRGLALLSSVLISLWSKKPLLGMAAGTLIVLVLSWIQ